MRTEEAENKRDEAITKAREKGHDPMLLTKSGAMELWVCKLCGRPMDAWDNPAVVNGVLPNVPCPGEQWG